ncbi:hypothetical protein J3R82DRAFT_9294 [Butyriboletus roseoflavus]|nr:hypothetical protein J3R82DRAFT_9294 [Butyriboletus roseoflavus]
MATFEYVEIPADAVRLKPSSLEPATRIFTSLPDTTRTSSSPWRTPSEPLSPAKSALALVPQMLLSASIPNSVSPATSIIASAIATPSPRTASHTLLSTRDPLSVPIMTANFRRFVSKVGPVFWLQDRIEEIILWKKGWKRTTVWLAAYGFFCYFPRMALLVPHILLLSVMLCYYPDPGAQPVPINVGEGTADWQANIQAIQNLMGAFSDAHDAIVPLLPLLVAPQTPPSSIPSPPKPAVRFSIPTSTPTPSYEPISHPTPKPPRHTSDPPSPPATHPATQPHHPLLIVTLVTFFLFIPILMTVLLPLRLLFFLVGAGSVGVLHPRIKGSLSLASTALSGTGPGLSFQLCICIPRLPNPLSLLPIVAHRFCDLCQPPRTHTFTLTLTPRDIYLFLRQLTDNDKLDDTVWHAPLAHVELWENERWIQDAKGGEEDAASTTSTSTATTGTVTRLGDGAKGMEIGGTWSKVNLKPNERVGWTRGRDGWSGVGGEVSSNLTFSLSPGWAFVETEGWRPDLSAAWAVEGHCAAPSASVCVGADEDGWTYTTDMWTHPRPDARPCDGWVTRRRRWVRRVYFKGIEL